MANKFQVKRTSVSGRTPNTTSSGNTHYIDTGELALNLTDGKLFSSNGTAHFEVGANLTNIVVSNTANITGNTLFGGVIFHGTSQVNSQLITSDKYIAAYQNEAPGFTMVAAGNTSNTQRGVFKATRSRGTLLAPTVPLVNDDVVSFLGAVYDGDQTLATGELKFIVDGTVSDNVGPQAFVISTGNTNSRIERLRVTSSGNVGIGNTAPAHKLSVNGDALISNDLTLSSNLTVSQFTSMANGLSFGSAVAADANTNSRHIQIWGTQYGFNVTNNRLNYNAASGATHWIRVGNNDILSVNSTAVAANATLTHNGLVLSTGTNVDQVYSVTDTLTVNTSWQSTSVNGTELATGSYIVQVTTGNEVYTGTMSWYSGDANSNTTSEIPLHRASPGIETDNIFLRLLRSTTAATDMVVQIAGTATRTSANYTLKFRRMI